jgi:type IV pilus assembly protein PilB
MNLNFELLQYYQFKRVVKRKERNIIFKECERLGIPVDKYMIAKQYCTEVSALPALGEFLSIPYAEMDMFDVDRELLDKFSLTMMKKHKIVPITIDKNGIMLLAVGKPLDFVAMSVIATMYTGKFDYVYVPSVQIDVFIDSIVAVLSTTSALESLQKDRDQAIIEQTASSDIEMLLERGEDVINAPAVRLVDSIIKEAIPFRASDIHIEPYVKSVRVRYRIDGDLSERAEFPIESYPAIAARFKILSALNIAERRIPQDGRINMFINGKEYDFRVSTLPTAHGEKFSIRVLDKTAFNFSRAELGFTPEENVIVDKILAHPHGVVLLSGPTGCGKSTTLYAFLKELNSADVNIVTVEDPVEYTMHGINQVQVNPKANLTFATALRSILRQDPDIIMLGEIRDEETAQIAIRAAITGHLVFSTLHTNDAPSALTRLIDMGVTSYLVADALVAVIAQRLVKRLCPVCKKRGKTNPREMEILGLTEPIRISRPQGCQFCNGTGYKGRLAVHETMYMTEEMKNIINKDVSSDVLREMAIQNGMTTLFDACKVYVLKGVTSISELMSVATNI